MMLTESLLAQLSELEIVIGLNKKCDPSVAYGANKCSPSFKDTCAVICSVRCEVNQHFPFCPGFNISWIYKRKPRGRGAFLVWGYRCHDPKRK